MARTPRPVDPTAGPVQSFAHDLRALREEAGNPTYRALAKTAGFSATTLGDAAGGVRLPSLEVALAYVGACGGDTEAWRVRWQELNRQLAVKRGGAENAENAENAAVPDISDAPNVPDTAEPPEAAEALDPPTTAPPAATTPTATTPASRFRLRRRPAVLAAVGALVLIAAVLAWRLPAMDRSSAASVTHPALAGSVSANSATTPPDCPAFASGPGTFTADTYEAGTKVRSGPSTDAIVREQIPSGCTLRFTGYCLGEVVASGLSGSPDMRWFELTGGGVISSAILHGDPTPGMAPTRCPGDVPPPVSVALSSAPGAAGAVDFKATGSQVWIVGFAAFYPGAPGETPQWHQLTIIALATPAGVPELTAQAISSASGSAGIPVFADACYGGGSPSSVYTAGTLNPAQPTVLTPLTLGSADLQAAEMKACSYPTTT